MRHLYALTGKSKIGKIHVPWYWALPAIIMVVLIRYVPMFAGGYYAFTDWNGVSMTANFVGLTHFRKIFSSADGLRPLIQTLRYAVLIVVFSNVLGMIFATVLDRNLKSRYILRTIFFIPVIMLPMAISFTWKFIYQYNGLLNSLLEAVGLASMKRSWLADPSLSFYAVVIVVIWRWTGRCMIIYLAGLQNISDDILEAAVVDGATVWKRFAKIQLPLLAPSMTITFTLSLTAGLNIFDEIKALTDGGPNGLTESLATVIYTQSYVYGKFGYGAALSLVLMVLVTVVALFQMGVLRKRERNIEQ